MIEISYEEFIALVIAIVIAWIIIVFYRVGREGVIKKLDFWRAKWKIVLFWFVILAIVISIMVLFKRYDVMEFFNRE
jgi:hypothetical protein